MVRRLYLVVLLGALISEGCVSTPIVTFGKSENFSKQRVVAVLPFSDAKGDPGANVFVGWATEPNNGEAVASFLAESLVGCSAYRVIERSKLKAVLQEHNLSTVEIIERKGFKEVGRLLGADLVVVGNVNRYCQVGGLWFFADVSFSARCVDIATGEILWSASPSVQAFGSVPEYTKKMCSDIAECIRRQEENLKK